MAQKGDFIGFTFNGRHSSSFGIVRTSNGSRFNTNLLPQSLDLTVAVPGGDGVYFFGSNYTTRSFLLLIASDEISESQMREIKLWLGDKQLHNLIFDEAPYKVYTAKCTGMPQFNFICFDENGGRVYKGEGSIEFTAYYPFARSRYKFLNEYMKEITLSTQPNDWPVNYFKKVSNLYIMIVTGTTFIAGTYYKSIPEWYGGEFALGNGIFHNHYLLGDGIDIVFEDVYTEWTPVGETEEERATDWEGHKNELYIKLSEDEYIKLSEDAEYDDEEQYYTYEKVSHELINPHEEYSGSTISLINIDEWSAASGMLLNDHSGAMGITYDDLNSVAPLLVYVYNPGDIEADFLLWFVPNVATGLLYYKTDNTGDSTRYLSFDFSSLTAMPAFIQYDSKTELLTGYTENNGLIGSPNGKLYNKYITEGDFFKIPIMDAAGTAKIKLNRNTSASYIAKIEYNYLYI